MLKYDFSIQYYWVVHAMFTIDVRLRMAVEISSWLGKVISAAYSKPMPKTVATSALD